MQVFTASGRRLLPPVQLGGPPAFLAADAGWRLLAVAVSGGFWVWDLAALRVKVQGTAAPLLALLPARGAARLGISPSEFAQSHSRGLAGLCVEVQGPAAPLLALALARGASGESINILGVPSLWPTQLRLPLLFKASSIC